MTETPEEKGPSTFDEIIAAYDGEDRQLREMIERRAAIIELMRTPGWNHLYEFVQNEINRRSQRIVLGRLEIDEYQREAGWCQGALAPFQSLERIDSLIAQALAEEGITSLGEYDLPPEYDPDFPADQP